jgi:hypothetical protein
MSPTHSAAQRAQQNVHESPVNLTPFVVESLERGRARHMRNSFYLDNVSINYPKKLHNGALSIGNKCVVDSGLHVQFCVD